MNFRSYDDLASCMIKNIHRIPSDVDLILGIPRSGTMAGNMLALYTNLPFMDLYSYLNGDLFHVGNTKRTGHMISKPSEAKHILLVDDSISSGQAMEEACALLRKSGLKAKVTTLAVYGLAVTQHKVDVCFETCDQPRFFEWNFMHSWFLEYCCMDIDGVICEDPTRFQNDDGARYIDFLRNARPKLLPTAKVGKLVSCRLEKYREETVAWLKEHHVDYGELILLDGVTATQRALSFDHGAFKAKVYQASDCVLFLESDYDEALQICRISRKPVFCLQNRQIIDSGNVIRKLEIRQKEFGITMKHAVKKVLSNLC